MRRSWLEPEGEEPAGACGLPEEPVLFDEPGPSEADRATIQRILALESEERARGEALATASRWARDTAEAEALGAEVFGQEVFRRAAFAQSMLAVHALVGELLAQDREHCGHERSEAMEYAVHDVAAALGVSRRTAAIRMEDALLLVEQCPRTLAVLRAGYLPEAAARELAHRLADHPGGLRAAVETAVLDTLGAPAGLALGSEDLDELALTAQLHPDLAATVSLGASRGRVRDLIARLARELAPHYAEPEAPDPDTGDPDASEPAEPESVARPDPREGDVEAWATRPGFVFVGREFTQADATMVLDRNDTLARASKRAGDPRTLAQLRGAWFRDLLLAETGGQPAPGQAPTGGGGDGGCPGLRPVPVHLTVHLLDGRTTVDSERLGPINPEALSDLIDAAQRTAGTVQVRPVEVPECAGHTIVDGAVTEPGRYVVPPKLRQAIIARDRTCRFPGCTIPARSCDLDHSIPHPRGPTCDCNLACLCRGHHRLKTSGRWWLVNHGHGRLTWTSPTDRRYEVTPDPV